MPWSLYQQLVAACMHKNCQPCGEQSVDLAVLFLPALKLSVCILCTCLQTRDVQPLGKLAG